MGNYPTYNITPIIEGDGNIFVDLVQVTSQNTNYLPGILILLSVYLVLFLSLKLRGYNTWASATGCAFVNMILAILMYALAIIPGYVLVISIVILPILFLCLFLIE